MNLFYAPNSQEDLVDLPPDEARHCMQVLRHQLGDIIHWVDGKGTFLSGHILEANKRNCRLSVSKRQEAYHQRPFHLHLAIAPTKQIDRLEWFLEKSTEIGIDEITLLQCAHSERRKVRVDRLNKILVSAMKQSLKAYLPILHDFTSYATFVEKQSRDSQRFIAYVDTDQTRHLKDNFEAKKEVCILIGPEGGFHPDELKLAIETGFQQVSLGSSRLRTETAGVVACTIANLINL